MIVYVDTSAIYAYFDGRDEVHQRMRALWDRLLDEETGLITTNYVMTEATALLQRRLGLEWVQRFLALMSPELEVVWVDEPLHQGAVSALLTESSRDVSLVDFVSFTTMRELNITHALTADRHFVRFGFKLYRGEDVAL